MRGIRLLPLLFVPVLAVLLVSGAGIVTLASAQGGQLASVVVSLSESEVSTLIGESFTFTSEIVNEGEDTTPELVAHLNVVSLDQGVYVDPEDWSPERTINVDPVPPGASATQSWTVKPVLKGDVTVYLVVLPNSAALTTEHPLVASPGINVHVEEKRSLNPGGVLPVVLAVPGALAMVSVGLLAIRRRR